MRTFARLLVAIAVPGWVTAAGAQARPALSAAADTNDWNAYYERGVELLRGNPAAADELFRWAVRLDPSRPEPLYGRWVAFHLRDKYRFMRYLRADDAHSLRDPAVVAADSLQLRAIALNPFFYRALLAAAYAQLPGGWARDRYTHAFLEYAYGRLDRAEAELAELARTARDKVPARYTRALVLANLRRYDEARVELDSVVAALRATDERRVRAVYQSKEMLMYSIGLLYLAQNRYPEAREAFAQAVVEDASQWYTHRGLALTLRTEGRTAEALGEYRTALELAGDEPMLIAEYADALTLAGDHAAAVEQLTRLVRLVPDWAAAWRALGDAEVRAGNGAAAAAAFSIYLARARRGDPAAVRVRDQLAQLRTPSP